MNCVTVFLVQSLYVCLLGWQSQNVRDGRYVASAATSTVLGFCGLFITSVIARAAIIEADLMVILSFILAGPSAITFSIWSHKKWNAKRNA